MTIHPLVSLPYKQAQNTSETLEVRRRRKTMYSQKYNQEPTEDQNLSIKLQRRGLERLKNKNLKV